MIRILVIESNNRLSNRNISLSNLDLKKCMARKPSLHDTVRQMFFTNELKLTPPHNWLSVWVVPTTKRFLSWDFVGLSLSSVPLIFIKQVSRELYHLQESDGISFRDILTRTQSSFFHICSDIVFNDHKNKVSQQNNDINHLSKLWCYGYSPLKQWPNK